MLLEEQRGILIADLKQNVVYTYGDWDPNPGIFRHGEGFDKHLPYITVEYLPTSRNLFRSMSDLIGNATPLGEYKEFGYCQIENICVRCYVNKLHRSRVITGRLLAEHLALTTLRHIVKTWGAILRSFNASIDKMSTLRFRDTSEYSRKTGTKMIIYEFDIYARTQFRWNYVPSDYVQEPLILGIGQSGDIVNIDYDNVSE